MQNEAWEGDSSTWTALVNTAVSDDRRACIFCGKTNMVPHRSLLLDEVYTQLDRVEDDAVRVVIKNVTDSAGLVYTAYGSSDSEARVVSCMCCMHWLGRRSKRSSCADNEKQQLPLQALRQYIRTLQCNSGHRKGETFDARVVHRMATTLTQDKDNKRWNYYLTLFSESERTLLYSLRQMHKQSVHAEIGRHYFNANAHTPFFPSKAAAELVRSAVTGSKGTSATVSICDNDMAPC